jgi:hypothetical protein
MYDWCDGEESDAAGMTIDEGEDGMPGSGKPAGSVSRGKPEPDGPS